MATPVPEHPDNRDRPDASAAVPHAGEVRTAANTAPWISTPPIPGRSGAAWLAVELGSVEENLALDEALLELAHEGLAGTTCVRTWMAGEPTVVLGSSGRLAEEVDLEACARRGVRVIRRPSGGGTVLLGPGCLMWSVVVPHPAGPPPIESIHAAMLAPLAAALCDRLRAVDDQTAAATVTRLGTSDLAITRATADDPPRKVAGTALRVRRHGVLYHGTLLDAFDLGLVSSVLRHPPREPGYRGGRSHGEFLANLGLGRATLERIVRDAFQASAVQSAWPSDRVARLVRDRYATAAWNERR